MTVVSATRAGAMNRGLPRSLGHHRCKHICLVALAAVVLVALAVVAVAWIAGRIYRVGILMQGKRPTLPERWRWLQRLRVVRGAVAWVRYLRRLRALRDVDLVHLFSASWLTFFLFSVPAIATARRRHLPVVMHYHGGGAGDFFRRWGWLADRFVRAADRLVVPSGYLAEVFANRGFTATIIPNPVELEPPRQVAGPPVVLSCRNLYPVYDVATAVRAFARLHEQFPEARLEIAGAGPERPTLERTAAELGLTGALTFHGNLGPEAMADLRRRATILLNASRADNQPVSLLEAMAGGLAIVSTDAGGIPLLVRHEREALLAPVGDAKSLGEHLRWVAATPSLHRRLTHAARARVAGHAWSVVGARWLRLYTELVGREFSTASRSESRADGDDVRLAS